MTFRDPQGRREAQRIEDMGCLVEHAVPDGRVVECQVGVPKGPRHRPGAHPIAGYDRGGGWRAMGLDVAGQGPECLHVGREPVPVVLRNGVKTLDRRGGLGVPPHLTAQPVEQRLDPVLKRHHPGDALLQPIGIRFASHGRCLLHLFERLPLQLEAPHVRLL
ncbi:MAG: hypothetical protein HY332_01305 [Chloroflexi bacterium]|nr:hypothetical protein [Chloroflexota bacterium]